MNKLEQDTIYEVLMKFKRFQGKLGTTLLSRVLNEDILVRKVTKAEADEIIGERTRCDGFGVLMEGLQTCKNLGANGGYWFTATMMEGLEFLKENTGSDVDVYIYDGGTKVLFIGRINDLLGDRESINREWNKEFANMFGVKARYPQ